MGSQVIANWIEKWAKVHGVLVAEKPLADFVGYRWVFKLGEPFRWFATIEIGPAAILELAGYLLEERRASVCPPSIKCATMRCENERGCGVDPQPLLFREPAFS
jgi:hypothetical protein